MEHVPSVVLVVEVDPPVRELLSDVLKDEGYDVVTAYDGEGACRMVAARRVDVVAIDVDAAEASGLLQAARGSSVEPCIVALCSSQPPSSEARRAHLVVAKPFDVDELVEAVRGLLVERRAAQPAVHARAGHRPVRARTYRMPERAALVSLPVGG